MRWLALAALLVGALACSQSGNQSLAPDAVMPNVPWPVFDAGAAYDATSAPLVDDGGQPLPLPDDSQLVVDRPYALRVPEGYRVDMATPLVVLLHGYGVNGYLQDIYFGLGEIVDQKGFLYAIPDGTPDPLGQRFWNATDACCNFFGAQVDDVAYVRAIIHDVQRRYNVDAKRVFLVGHSNGGFLVHRLACELSSQVAAIISLAGAQWGDASRCQPSRPVSVLEVHGTLDDKVLFGGGSILGHDYPAAAETVGRWAVLNGCQGSLEPQGTNDVDFLVPGAETRIERYGLCPAGGAAELWTVQWAGHIPALRRDWATTIYHFFEAHPQP